MSNHKNDLNRKSSDNKSSDESPAMSERCKLCEQSQVSVCKYPYSEYEVNRFLEVGVLFQQGISADNAVKQLIKNKGWHPQSTRNCVNQTYSTMEKMKGFNPYRT